MASGFFSMLLRMKYIDRWSLMRNTQRETLAEHTIDTAILAHALAVIGQTRFHRSVDPRGRPCLPCFMMRARLLRRYAHAGQVSQRAYYRCI